MSFDLYLFDREVPDDPEAISEILEDDSTWNDPLTQPLQAAVAELEERFPDDENDPIWATWPLTDDMMGGAITGFNIVWSQADRMYAEMIELAQRHRLTLYDPQNGVVTRPQTGAAPKPRWWKRR